MAGGEGRRRCNPPQRKKKNSYALNRGKGWVFFLTFGSLRLETRREGGGYMRMDIGTATTGHQ